MREDEIYFLTKNWFIRRDFKVLGGQPPRGTDRHPVIEIKSSTHKDKGSRSSFKPDLVVAAPRHLLLVECKPEFDGDDVDKLLEISQSAPRRQSLVEEIRQRRSLERHNHSLAQLSNDFLSRQIRCCISYSGTHHPVEIIYSLVFENQDSIGQLFLGDALVSSFT